MSDEMTKGDRDALIRIAKARAKQAEREAEMREQVLYAEAIDLMTAEFEVRDALWADATAIAEEFAAKANAQIQARCVELGIPAHHAPQLQMIWRARSGEFADRSRRGELKELAKVKLSALTKTAKTAIQGAALNVEERLVVDGLESGAARAVFDAMPTVEQLMPSLTLEDLGVKHWQPPEDAAGQLTTPLTTAQRRRRQIRRAIEANPDASDRAIAQIAHCDHKTVAAYRRDLGELPAITGEFPNNEDDR